MVKAKRKSRHSAFLQNVDFLDVALAVMIDTMHPDAPSDLIIHHLFSEQVLMY